MRHRVAIRHLSRTASHRIAMRRNMAQSLLQHGAIRTTEPKAKELRRFVEKLITTARRGTLHARRLVAAEMGDRLMVDDEGELQEKTVLQKLFDEIAPRYVGRPGGYTRILKRVRGLGKNRLGDNAETCIFELVGQEAEREAADKKKIEARKKEKEKT